MEVNINANEQQKNKEIKQENKEKQNAFDVNKALSVAQLSGEEKLNYLDRMIKNSQDKNLKLQIEKEKQVDTGDFEVIEQSDIPVQKLPAARDTWKARRAENSALKDARKVFADADTCTVREMDALSKYVNSFSDVNRYEITGKDEPYDPKLMAYVTDMLYMEISDKHLTDEYLADHIGEIFDYSRKLGEYSNLKSKYPKFFEALPEEKKMLLEEKAETAGELIQLLEVHLNYHGIQVSHTEGVPSFSLMKSKKIPQSMRDGQKREYDVMHRDFYQKNILNMALITATQYTSSKAMTAKASLDSISKRITGRKEEVNANGRIIDLALTEVKKALAVRDELIAMQIHELNLYKDLPAGQEKDYCINRIKAQNAKIRIATSHIDHYRSFIDFMAGNVKEIPRSAIDFFENNEDYEIVEVINEKLSVEGNKLYSTTFSDGFESIDETDYHAEKLEELRNKKYKRTNKDEKKRQKEFDEAAEKRKEYHFKLIDSYVVEDWAKEYYKDLALLLMHYDRRKNGLAYIGNTGDKSWNKRITTNGEINKILKRLRNSPMLETKNTNPKEKDKIEKNLKLKSDFIEIAEKIFDEKEAERKENEDDSNLSEFERMTDKYLYKKGSKWNYYVSSKADYEDSGISGNIAAPKLLQKLGCPPICQRIEKIQIINSNDEENTGFMVRKIPKEIISQDTLKKEKQKGKRIIYTEQAIRQMSAIRLSCYLLGDVDFNAEDGLFFDILSQGETSNGTFIIDSVRTDSFNSPFGFVSGREVLNGDGTLPSISEVDFQLLDEEFVDNILNLKEGDIRKMLGDTLDSDQIMYFESRLEKIKEKLNEIKQADKDKPEEDKIIVKKGEILSKDRLQKVQERIHNSQHNVFQDDMKDIKLLGLPNGDDLDENGDDLNVYDHKVLSTFREKMLSQNTVEGKLKYILDMAKLIQFPGTFSVHGSKKYQCVSFSIEKVLGENLTKELHYAIIEGLVDCHLKFYNKYNEIVERLKDIPTPESFRETEIYKNDTEILGTDTEETKKAKIRRAESKAREAFIAYHIVKEDTEFYNEFKVFECIRALYLNSTSYLYRSYDSRVDKDMDRLSTSTLNEISSKKLLSYNGPKIDGKILLTFLEAFEKPSYVPDDYKEEINTKSKELAREEVKTAAGNLFDEEFLNTEYNKTRELEQKLQQNPQNNGQPQ